MAPAPSLSVVVCTHEPHPARLARTLAGLRAQQAADWELWVIDNASQHTDVGALLAASGLHAELRREPELGLSAARRCGLRAARGAWIVLVDDDNVLAPDYLSQVRQIVADRPQMGCFGGRISGEFERPAQPWQVEFLPLLALVDHGPEPRIDTAAAVHAARAYPSMAPVGAGMVLSRAAAQAWLSQDAARTPDQRLSDRRGQASSSSGDNDIVLCALAAGLDVGYFPSLQLTHLIPASRLDTAALGRLNRGIQCSWMQLLSLHGINPWPPISRLGARLRMVRAWWRHRVWRGDAHWVRWMGACGHFEGRTQRPMAQPPRT